MSREDREMSAGGGRARPLVAAWQAQLPRILNAGALAALAAVLAASLGLVACKSSSATDRDKGNEELRAMESDNARYAPTITMSERVGCEVCPDWCQYVDLHLIPMPELFRRYRADAAMKYDVENVSITEVEERVRAGRAIHRISCIVARSSPDVQTAFLQYLDDESSLYRSPPLIWRSSAVLRASAPMQP